jgi:hypothetical protein
VHGKLRGKRGSMRYRDSWLVVAGRHNIRYTAAKKARTVCPDFPDPPATCQSSGRCGTGSSLTLRWREIGFKPPVPLANEMALANADVTGNDVTLRRALYHDRMERKRRGPLHLGCM